MAKTLGPRVHLTHVLQKVLKNRDGSFQLLFQAGEKEVCCDILVLAMPCSVYGDIIFGEEVIPKGRLQDIQNVQYGTNAKILVPFSTFPKARAGVISDEIVSFFDWARSVLTLYYSKEASRFSKETILDTYTATRPMMEKCFEDGCPPFQAPLFAEDRSFVFYAGPVGYSWPNDPYAKGTYSYIAPGQEALLTDMTEEKGEKFKTLFAPIEERIYFAGEHASILLEVAGTMEAACESGERVARAILNNHGRRKI